MPVVRCKSKHYADFRIAVLAFTEMFKSLQHFYIKGYQCIVPMCRSLQRHELAEAPFTLVKLEILAFTLVHLDLWHDLINVQILYRFKVLLQE